MYSSFWKATAVAVMLSLSTPAVAEPIVSIAGASANEATVTVHEFDLAQLEALGERTIRTKIVSLPGEHDATGVLMRDLLNKLNLKGETVQVTALDGYAVDIPLADFMNYDVILATKLDGKPMSVRDKGPSWIIYPVSQHPELDDPTVEAKSVWQIKTLAVK